MGGEAQVSWSGSAGLNPAETLTVILVKRHSQAGPAWGSPDGIKGQDNIHVGSSVTSWERQENTAWSWEHVSLHCGAKVLWIPSAVSMCWADGYTNLVLPHSFCPLCAAAQGMDIKGVQCVSGASGTQ